MLGTGGGEEVFGGVVDAGGYSEEVGCCEDVMLWVIGLKVMCCADAVGHFVAREIAMGENFGGYCYA